MVIACMNCSFDAKSLSRYKIEILHLPGRWLNETFPISRMNRSPKISVGAFTQNTTLISQTKCWGVLNFYLYDVAAQNLLLGQVWRGVMSPWATQLPAIIWRRRTSAAAAGVFEHMADCLLPCRCPGYLPLDSYFLNA